MRNVIPFLLWSIFFIHRIDNHHFNGGTITWEAVDPYSNASSLVVTITQTYSWSYPTIKCANDVPITTSGRRSQNDNLTCVVDCSTDGGYSAHPINILTDCTSSSSSLGMMTSQKSKIVTLTAGAHFSLAFQGSAWRSIGSPAESGLDWSILSVIDLRKRSDGFINTPPVATVASPQYLIVNQPTKITIPVSDANAGDDVRCRWSTNTAGYRRRRREEQQKHKFSKRPSTSFISSSTSSSVATRVRHARQIGNNNGNNNGNGGGSSKTCSDSDCQSACSYGCPCSCSACQNTDCSDGSNTRCSDYVCTTSATVATTSETAGTKKSTSSYIHRQAVDECGGICYPDSTPTGTTLANCTITFTGLVAGAW